MRFGGVAEALAKERLHGLPRRIAERRCRRVIAIDTHPASRVPPVGRTRSLLVAVLALLSLPATGLAAPCTDATTGTATTGVAISVTSASATITGTFDPAGQVPASYRFELGPTPNYGSSTPARATTISTVSTVNEKLGALTPGTTYHYRLVGTTSCTVDGPRRDVHDAALARAAAGPPSCRSSSAPGSPATPRSRSPAPTAAPRGCSPRIPRATSIPPSRRTARAWCSRACAAATATCTSSARMGRGSCRSRPRATPTRRPPGPRTASRSCSHRPTPQAPGSSSSTPTGRDAVA